MAKVDINIAQIVSQSSLLSERQSDFTIDTNPDQQAVEQRLERWCQVVAQGNWDLLERRWHWDELDMAKARSLLATRRIDDWDLPPWVATLSAIIHTAAEFDPKEILNLPLDTEKPLPFEDLLLPVILARQRLGTTKAKWIELLTDNAYLSLERNLLQRLVNLCTPTLNSELCHFRPLGHNLLNVLLPDIQKTANKVHFRPFFVAQQKAEPF